MARGGLTTTSYAILGLLSVKPWSTYELTQQMDRSLGNFWPRAQSKLYEEPKKLVEQGLARGREEAVGQRTRTVYSITPKGRRALAAWLHDPGSGPVLEFEQLLKVFFSDAGTKEDALASIRGAADWARDRSAFTARVGRQYARGEGEFPERAAQRFVTVRFLIDFFALVGEWARWAEGVVDAWPDDPSRAAVDDGAMEEITHRADAAARA